MVSQYDCPLQGEPSHFQCSGYILALIDLAHEYVKLGKTRRAASIFKQALDVVRSGEASDEVCVHFNLRFAEALATAEEVEQR